MGKPRLTMRTRSGTTDWKKAWQGEMQAVRQNFIMYGNLAAKDVVEKMLETARSNIVRSVTGHLKNNSGFVERMDNSRSALVGYKAFFDTTVNMKSAGAQSVFNYAYKVHEDGTSPNFHFLKNAYDAQKDMGLRHIKDSLRQSLGRKTYTRLFGKG